MVVFGILSGVNLATGVTAVAAREAIADARRAEWALRPEVENWANPYWGLDWLVVVAILSWVTLLVGSLVFATSRAAADRE